MFLFNKILQVISKGILTSTIKRILTAESQRRRGNLLQSRCSWVKSSLFLLLIVPHPFAWSQLPYAIRGKIVDSVSHAALPFAQVSLSITGSGTATNEEGEFRFDNLQADPKDTLRIFFMGYETRRIPVRNLSPSASTILLKPAAIQLSEFELIGLTPVEVIRRAVAAIPANYGKDPLILTAFIRSQKSVNNKLGEYTEAIIEDLKNGYYLYKPGETERKHKLSNISLLLKGRVISDTNLVNAMGDVGRNVGCLGCNFINDISEFYHSTILDEDLLRYYDLSMEEMISPADGKIYHIRFAQKKGTREKLWKGELFIDAASYAIMKLTQKPSMYAYDAYEKNKYNRGFTILNKPGWVEEMPFIEQTVTYSKQDQFWILSTIRSENWMTFTYPATGQRLKFSYKNDVVVTNISRDPDRIKNFKGEKLTGSSQRWDQIIGRPDENFWTHFNYLPVEETLKKAIEGIGK